MPGVVWMCWAALLPQDEGTRLLVPGPPVQGEITPGDPEVADADLELLRDRIFLPLRGRRIAVEVQQGGVYALQLELPQVHAYAVLRDDDGRLVAAGFQGELQAWRLELRPARYRLDCCATFSGKGAFTVQMIPFEQAPTLAQRTVKARELLALRLRSAGVEPVHVAAAYDWLGFLLYQQSDYRAALECMQQALPLWQQHCGPDSLMAAYGHNQVAAQLRGLGQLEAARTHQLEALRLREAGLGPDHFRTLSVRNMLGAIEQQRGDLAAAEACFARVAASPPQDDPRQLQALVTARSNLAYVASLQGRFSAGWSIARQALADAEANWGPDDLRLGWTLSTAEKCAQGLGRLADAELLARRVLALRERGLPPDHADTATSRNNLAVILLERGNAAEAAVQFAACLETWRKRLGERHLFVAIGHGNLGDSLMRQGRLDEDEQQLRQAAAMLEDLGMAERLEMANVLGKLGEAAFRRRDFDAAAASMERALAVALRHGGPLHPTALRLRMQAGLMDRLAGRFAAAEAQYPDLLEALRAVYGPDNPTVNAVAAGTAILHATAGRSADAMTAATAAVAGRLRHLQGELVASSSENRFRDAAGLRSSVDLLLTVAAGLDPAAIDTAFALHAAAQGIVYRHALRQREWTGDDEPADLRELRSELEVCRAALARLAYAGSPADRDEQAQRLRALHAEKLALEARLGARLGLRLDEEHVTASALLQRLPLDAVLLDFAFHAPFRCARVENGTLVAGEGYEPPRLLAFVLRAGAAHAARVDFGEAAPIRQAIDDFLHELTARRGRTAQRADQPRPNDVLRRLVWEPLEPLLDDRPLVFVAAEGDLARLPLAALQLADGRFLLEQRMFVHVQDPISLDRELRRAVPGRAAPPRLLAFGAVDYGSGGDAAEAVAGAADDTLRSGFQDHWASLPQTRGEVEAILALHRARFPTAARQSFTDGAASKSNLVARIAQADVLHLATHGFFEPAGVPSLWQQALGQSAGSAGSLTEGRQALDGYPPGLLTGLVLAGANHARHRADAVLTAEEVHALPLRSCDLVVLSACETALGEMRGGEGMLSLRRAFHEAGARTVVSSLWSVLDDATARLMRSFYDNLWQHGLPPAQALRQAQLAMLELDRRRRGNGQPGAWGAFVLSGEWR